MIKLDREKFEKRIKFTMTLRPEFGAADPIEVKEIRCVYTDDNDYVTAVDYAYPTMFDKHYAYGHQIDEINFID